MSTTHFKNLLEIFRKSVYSVKPESLFSSTNNYLKLRHDKGAVLISIQGQKFNITNKQVHVVGFGKAVLSMALQLQTNLGDYLIDGIISTPVNSVSEFKAINSDKPLSAHITVHEGALNNLPDEAAHQAAKEIMKFAKRMSNHDVLFVLISGGGSALLPMPKPPVTLHEKYQLVRKLSGKGADIIELNTVRISLSKCKGGRLALAAKNASAIITFIISDVIGDPIDIIASGPTVKPMLRDIKVVDVLKKYDLYNNLPQHIKNVLNESETVMFDEDLKNSFVFVIGNNTVATNSAMHEARSLSYESIVLSRSISSEVRVVVKDYIDLLQLMLRYFKRQLKADEIKNLFPYDADIFADFLKALNRHMKDHKSLLLIFAGEPTVQLQGVGIGGRNQELALRMSLELAANPDLQDVIFLSAGTDGQDGPTQAAGAFGGNCVVESFLKLNPGHTIEDIQTYLNANDSYSFYQNLNEGQYHIITGMTGTNVMDLHFLMLPWRSYNEKH